MSPPASLPLSVLQALASVRRRRRGLAALEAMAWMLGGLAVLLAVLPFAPSPAPAGLRWIAMAGLLASFTLPALVVFLPVWRRTRSLFALARAVDDRVPGAHHRLLTAVDLATALDRGRLGADPETERLARVHLRHTEGVTRSVRPEQLLPLRGLPPRTLLGPALLLLVGVAVVARPEPFRVGAVALFGAAPVDPAAGGSEPDLPVTLTLRNVTVRLIPPAYSGRAEMELEGSAGDLVALPGTRVRLQADGADGGRSSRVRLTGRAEPSEGTVQGERIVIEFVTGLETSYRVEVERGLGREPLRTRAFVVEILPDRPPELEVLAPGGRLTLLPADELPVQVRARDDFALSRVERVILAGGKEIARLSLGDVAGRSTFDGETRLSAADLGGEGGELQLVVEAWDNDMALGPKMTSSRPIELYVPTARDQQKKVLVGKQRLLEEALDLLADVLVVNAQGTGLDGKAAILAAHDRQQTLADAFLRTAAELVQAMADSPLETAKVLSGVVRITENLERRWRDVADLVEAQVRPSKATRIHRVTVGDLVAARDGAIAELEQVVLDLASFVDAQRGQEVQGDLAALADQFARTQELLRRADAGEPVSADLEAALKDLAERMQEVARKLAERQSGPDEGFMNSMPNELSPSMLAEVRELIAKGKYEEAMAKLAEADAALSAMEEALNQELGNAAGGQSADSMDAALQAAIAQAKELETKQEKVLEETDALAEKFGPPTNPAEQAALSEQVAALRRKVEELGAEDGDPFTRNTMRRAGYEAQQELEGLDRALAAGELDDAAAYAQEIQRLAGELSSELAQSPPGAAGAGAQRQAKEAKQLAGGIADALRRRAGEQRAAQQQAEKAGTGAKGRQAAVAQGVGALREQAGQLPGSAYNPASGRDSLQNAEQLLRKAESRLGEGDPGRAQGAGQDGLNQLREFRQGLEAAQQAMRQTGAPRPGGSGRPGEGQRAGAEGGEPGVEGDESGKIEMTDPDEFVGPEAWRALLQEGAQGDAPERYQPLNGTYYEELIR